MDSTTAIGFEGERQDPVALAYPLGDGYRWYLPGLMRFAAPDNLSPFQIGGVNPYADCADDPINVRDPSGHAPTSSLRIFGDFTESLERLVGDDLESASVAGMDSLASNASGSEAPAAESRERIQAPFLSLHIALKSRDTDILGMTRRLKLESYWDAGSGYEKFDEMRSLAPGEGLMTNPIKTGFRLLPRQKDSYSAILTFKYLDTAESDQWRNIKVSFDIVGEPHPKPTTSRFIKFIRRESNSSPNISMRLRIKDEDNPDAFLRDSKHKHVIDPTAANNNAWFQLLIDPLPLR
ncbi:RHS repeat-associated core domain-containing protein [Trinickia caryophylli]|uniref:RHS repeat-associated core domain-containing protein n=1 Tax=Trinickia caryophylli TaxID=28094 RepID=A0A1X7FQI4_TRICW|nr:RHS repeat-associated core domain-containing protein [Trinickia caryophylli]PMS09516.1 RHS repeat-associated core domain-containing protein [Trinickia caryophylli]TRX14446.1 RHS repeat-associated core domain-containing protein [Trinickia caryophylli]WQE14283.1 RHS repeat-associated core domain-containing protein [Trinickia caryophylli]SMF56466.1 RHS repeat-associated core domain-containing protein [Trinickia caryophylli]GLU33203.1 hypothetical protein Busp01_30450 [Trinickia caryophylli]